MYIFGRTGVAAPGKTAAAMTFAIEVAAKVTSITDIPLNVYRGNFGGPLGTILWSSRYESQAQAFEVEAKVLGNASYLAMVDSATDLFLPTVTDGLTEIVSTSMAAPAALVAVTMATIANGKIAEAMELGVAIQAAVAKATGLGTAFCADVYGTYGGVRWILGGGSIADLDKARAAMNTDTALQALVGKAGDVYLAGSGQNSLLTKIN